MFRHHRKFPSFPSPTSSDLKIFATSAVEKSLVLKAHPDKEHILRVLIDSSDGMMLWIALMIKELERGRWNIHSVLERDRKSTRLNSSHSQISYAVFCLKKKK